MRAFNLLPDAPADFARSVADAADALAPALESVARIEQPSDAALAAIGEQVDALAERCPLCLASEMR